ncbi:MAG: PAAR domain-containing protein [Opitutaceae bacterium]|nr:PAAR domain-containing protein [Cytophagales bacterium]
MAGKPIATVGSMHVCAMVTGTVPHVGGPISGPGASNVLINGKPAALMGDMCTCVGPPDVAVMGNALVKINGKAVVCQGDMTAHGGSIVMGESNVTIGSATPEPSVLLPVREIPFPKITTMSRVAATVSGNGKSLKEAEKNMEKVKEEAKKHGYLDDYFFSI